MPHQSVLSEIASPSTLERLTNRLASPPASGDGYERRKAMHDLIEAKRDIIALAMCIREMQYDIRELHRQNKILELAFLEKGPV